ncbi:MAG: hypothetical protein AAF639_37320 [Chloroflexota bacterium]
MTNPYEQNVNAFLHSTPAMLRVYKQEKKIVSIQHILYKAPHIDLGEVDGDMRIENYPAVMVMDTQMQGGFCTIAATGTDVVQQTVTNTFLSYSKKMPGLQFLAYVQGASILPQTFFLNFYLDHKPKQPGNENNGSKEDYVKDRLVFAYSDLESVQPISGEILVNKHEEILADFSGGTFSVSQHQSWVRSSRYAPHVNVPRNQLMYANAVLPELGHVSNHIYYYLETKHKENNGAPPDIHKNFTMNMISTAAPRIGRVLLQLNNPTLQLPNQQALAVASTSGPSTIKVIEPPHM